MTLSAKYIIAKKRDGGELSEEELRFWVRGLTQSTVSEAQVGAFCMAVVLKGLSSSEAAHLTKAMLESGHIFSWPEDWKESLVDKHSTGGVGDKISLVLAPALAACGRKVPMVSGRGLGITGGTLDKLESIPGFNVDQSSEAIVDIVDKVGCCIVGQTKDIAPADKIMYRCRDETETVGNVGLVTSSILCKKAAESVGALVLDIKYGKGTYTKDLKGVKELGNSLLEVSRMLGMKTCGVVCTMDDPVGKAVGNALEVKEAIACLKGQGPKDLTELVLVEGALLLTVSKPNGKQEDHKMTTLDEGKAEIMKVLQSGEALQKFCDMLVAQGVAKIDAEELCFNLDNNNVLKKAPFQTEIKVQSANAGGIITGIDAGLIASVSNELGGNRGFTESGKIDHTVGVELIKGRGEKVVADETWAVVHHTHPELSQRLTQFMHQAIQTDELLQRLELGTAANQDACGRKAQGSTALQHSHLVKIVHHDKLI